MNWFGIAKYCILKEWNGSEIEFGSVVVQEVEKGNTGVGCDGKHTFVVYLHKKPSSISTWLNSNAYSF